MALTPSPTGSTTQDSTAQNGVRALNNIAQILQGVFPQTSGVSGTATGGAATLPANPVGFLSVTLQDGTSVRIPYYGA